MNKIQDIELETSETFGESVSAILSHGHWTSLHFAGGSRANTIF